MRWLVGVALLGAMSCGPQQAGPAKLWVVQDFFAKFGTVDGNGDAPDFGGFTPQDLVVSATSKQLRVLPAVAEGKARGYVITEIWRDHPLPWIQPVWVAVESYDPLNPTGRRVNGVRTVFPVDVTGSFYSPFWGGRIVVAPGVKEQDFDSAQEVLAFEEVYPGGLLLCPITPEGATVQTPPGGAGPVHPYTGEVLNAPGYAEANVEGRRVFYMHFGGGRAPWHDDAVEATDMVVFVDAAGKLLPIPAVLPDAPDAHALVWRNDVMLPPDAAIFAPDTQPVLKTKLRERGQTVHPVGPGIPDATANAYAGRMAADAACFLDANFPASCTWRDSMPALARVSKRRTTVLLTVETLAVKVTP